MGKKRSVSVNKVGTSWISCICLLVAWLGRRRGLRLCWRGCSWWRRWWSLARGNQRVIDHTIDVLQRESPFHLFSVDKERRCRVPPQRLTQLHRSLDGGIVLFDDARIQRVRVQFLPLPLIARQRVQPITPLRQALLLAARLTHTCT